MSKIFKRLTALLLVLTLAGSLAACKKENDENSEALKVMNTEAVSVGNHKVSAAELNYFYMDAITDWYNTYGTSMGLDITKPLNEQVLNASTGKTWADNFLSIALENIQSTYALYDLAMANGFKLSEAEQKSLDSVITELETMIEYYVKLYSSYGMTYPYPDVASYLESVYGVGATVENYKAYSAVCTIAEAYYNAYADSLEYTSQQLREYEKDKYKNYCSYSFTVYFVSVADYESAEAAKADAELLASGAYADKDAFDAAIKALTINADKEKPTLSEANSHMIYTQIATDYSDWLSEAGRLPGDMGMIAKESTDSTTVKGYYVIRFDGSTDNNEIMKNFRHILIKFEGGVFNAITGETTYSAEAKAAAQFKAEELWVEYRTGSASELRFIDLANKNSDDNMPGGLYENVRPGQLPTALNDWIFDSLRMPGETALVESELGWHVLYFVGDAKQTYRDYMLENDLRNEDLSAWYDALLESISISLLNDTYVNKALIIQR